MVAEDLRDDVNKQGDNRAHADLHLRHIIICIWVCCSKTRSLTTAAGVIPCVQETGRQLNNPAETPTSRSGEENEQCSGFGRCELFRNSRRSVHPYTTISIRSAILTVAKNFKLNPAAALAQWRELSTA
jgi:hypothetical protein